MKVTAAAMALCAALALLMARLGFGLLADLLVLAAALGGVAAFVGAAVWTMRRARRLPSGPVVRTPSSRSSPS
jgi:hypothetical protein